MIGKSGTGKSTIINKIIGKEVFEVSLVKSSPLTQHINTTVHINNQKEYQCNFVEAKLVSPVICSSIHDSFVEQFRYIKEEVGGKLNLIIFVVRCGLLTYEEKYGFDMYIKVLHNCKCISACVITHCELYPMNRRPKILKECQHYMGDFVPSLDTEMYAVGFPYLDAVNDELSDYVAKLFTRNAQKDISELHQLIDKSNVAVDVSDCVAEATVTDTSRLDIFGNLSCMIL